MVGLSAGPLWNAGNMYTVRLAQEYSRVLQQEKNVMVSKFNGIFTGIQWSGSFLGSITAILVLGNVLHEDPDQQLYQNETMTNKNSYNILSNNLTIFEVESVFRMSPFHLKMFVEETTVHTNRLTSKDCFFQRLI
jgi:hypothetical protein